MLSLISANFFPFRLQIPERWYDDVEDMEEQSADSANKSNRQKWEQTDWGSNGEREGCLLFESGVWLDLSLWILMTSLILCIRSLQIENNTSDRYLIAGFSFVSYS
jgi:hypothetical protein